MHPVPLGGSQMPRECSCIFHSIRAAGSAHLAFELGIHSRGAMAVVVEGAQPVSRRQLARGVAVMHASAPPPRSGLAVVRLLVHLRAHPVHKNIVWREARPALRGRGDEHGRARGRWAGQLPLKVTTGFCSPLCVIQARSLLLACHGFPIEHLVKFLLPQCRGLVHASSMLLTVAPPTCLFALLFIAAVRSETTFAPPLVPGSRARHVGEPRSTMSYARHCFTRPVRLGRARRSRGTEAEAEQDGAQQGLNFVQAQCRASACRVAL